MRKVRLWKSVSRQFMAQEMWTASFMENTLSQMFPLKYSKDIDI